jgi:excisionase family DNA binding protein
MVKTASCVVKHNLQECRPSGMAALRPLEQHTQSYLEVCNEECQGQCGSKILRIAEVAEFFQCSAEKIKRLARSGELPAFKFGKTWFVREQDLEIYITQAVRRKTDRPKG